MIVQPKHFEFDPEKSRELAEFVDDQTLSEEQRDLIGESNIDQRSSLSLPRTVFIADRSSPFPPLWNGHGKHSADAVEIWLHPKCAEHL